MSADDLSPVQLFEPWETVRSSIKLIVEPLDDEAFEWQAPGTRTSAGWILRHLATAEEFWVAGVIQGQGFEPKRRRDFPGKSDILAELDRVHQRSRDLLQSLNLEQLFAGRRRALPPSPFAGVEFTLYEIFSILVTHDAHHRGQLQMLIRMMGREPDDRALLGRRASGGDGPNR